MYMEYIFKRDTESMIYKHQIKVCWNYRFFYFKYLKCLLNPNFSLSKYPLPKNAITFLTN